MRHAGAALGSMVAVLLLASTAFGQQNLRMSYAGELLDGDRRPISGVFPMTFELLDPEDGETELWSEVRFVAVYDGMYDIRLGRERAIPGALEGRLATLRVHVGEGEVARHLVTIRRFVAEDPAVASARLERITFADLSGRAIRADTADFAQNCRTLEGRTAAQIDRYESVGNQLASITYDLRRERRPGTGPPLPPQPRIGSAGGNPYQVQCPPGYVATGMRGGDGDLIDAVQIICSRLE